MNLTNLKETMGLQAFGLAKIPMILFLTPRVIDVSDARAEVRIALTRRSRNHLGSMYFGALAVGADCCGGMLAFRLIRKFKDKKISLVFKDFSAQFLKRPEGDVHFTCDMGPQIAALIDQAVTTGERCHLPLAIVATVPKVSGTEPVATFILTLSIKAT